ncbi:MAG: DNA methyltransferase [Erysipelotrichales bacterium]|nr:DNA methyltransferase [Erysipelotrichales bacterium]
MEKYNLMKTTIWSFPDRGTWATHKGDYRGNWSPHVPKNLILKYTKQGDLVFDGFLGSGTTAIEAKLLGRNFIGVDINKNALEITSSRLKFESDFDCDVQLRLGTSEKLSFIDDSSVDFICTHPPYADIIQYSDSIDGDLSLLEHSNFVFRMENVAREYKRILKKNSICTFMIGDIRKRGNFIPLGFLTMQKFIKVGFTLKEIIIKEQHNCKSSNYWKNRSNNFYLIAHEYIFIFINDLL